MSAVATCNDVATLELRATKHREVADTLMAQASEWAAVAAFYSSYQLVRASLIKDPIFDSVDRARVHVAIMPEDRFTSKHSGGGMRSKSLGVNELVTLLYRPIAGRYIRLHIASVQVRYADRLAFDLEALLHDCDTIKNQYDTGQLVYHRPTG